MRYHIFGTAFFISVFVGIVSCAVPPQTSLFTDSAEALRSASKSGRPLMIVFDHAPGTETTSAEPYSAALGALGISIAEQSFIDSVSRDYSLCLLLYSPDTAETVLSVSRQYGITTLPSVLLLTSSGFPCCLSTSIQNDAECFVFLEQSKTLLSDIYEQEQTANSSSQLQKAQILHRLITEQTKNGHIPERAYVPYMQEIIQSDPHNETDLAMLYTAKTTCITAEDLYTVNPDSACRVLETLIAENQIPPYELQRIYYKLAYMYAMNGAENNVIAGYLRKSRDAAPDSLASDSLDLLLSAVIDWNCLK